MVPSISNAKKVLAIFRSSTTAAATATGTVDRLGYDFCTIDVMLPTADVVSNKPTVLKVEESDTSNGTMTSIVTGGTDFTAPNCITAATSITQPYATFNIDLRARKRFLKLSISPATTQIVDALVTLTRQEQTPATSSTATVVVNA